MTYLNSMTDEHIERLVNSHPILCRGANKEGKPVFLKEEAEQVIVKIYEYGKTIPLCRFYDGSGVAPRCDFKQRTRSFSEDDLGVCPYSSK